MNQALRIKSFYLSFLSQICSKIGSITANIIMQKGKIGKLEHPQLYLDVKNLPPLERI